MQGARVEVGGGHPGRVPAGVQRLDARAGAEVERAVDRVADGEPGQRRGRPADAEHQVGPVDSRRPPMPPAPPTAQPRSQTIHQSSPPSPA